jgi:SEC-C motif domain protein
MANCPCGTKKAYAKCCKPYLLGQRRPVTPVALMRSRYTAYTLANITYIKKTMRGKALEGFQAADAQDWAKRVTWMGLTVFKTHLVSPHQGYVEFKAEFEEAGHLQSIHETSEFIQEIGVWYYVDGIQS